MAGAHLEIKTTPDPQKLVSARRSHRSGYHHLNRVAAPRIEIHKTIRSVDEAINGLIKRIIQVWNHRMKVVIQKNL